jgi:ABC-2 type transport system ATP-binding protein
MSTSGGVSLTAPRSTPAIRVSGITKVFGEVRAVDGVSFSVDRGEFFGLLGPNGAGKTTLVRILTGQLSPDKGEGETMGVPFRDGIEIKRKVGIVPESDTPPTFLTVQEFLELVCRLHDLDRIQGRVDKWLDFFDIMEKKDVLCRDLSKGQRQKIMLASAFIPEPELLLLDEPFINLDPVFQRKVREYLAEHVRKGKTVFMCTHILEIAEKLCTRIAIINRGGIVAIGALDEIRARTGERLEDIFIRLVMEE